MTLRVVNYYRELSVSVWNILSSTYGKTSQGGQLVRLVSCIPTFSTSSGQGKVVVYDLKGVNVIYY